MWMDTPSTPIGEDESHGHTGAEDAGKCSSLLASPFPAAVLLSGRGAPVFGE